MPRFELELGPDCLSRVQTNSELWRLHHLDGEPCLAIVGNTVDDQVGGKVALFFEPMKNCVLEAEFRFLGHHMEGAKAGWFGVVLRAQDGSNYELFWFMPEAEEKTVAYVPVAHGVVPWWTEAYALQTKGQVPIPSDRWFRVRAEVTEDKASIYVEGQLALEKRLTYYLSTGRAGVYVGTLTDAAFRHIVAWSVD